MRTKLHHRIQASVDESSKQLVHFELPWVYHSCLWFLGSKQSRIINLIGTIIFHRRRNCFLCTIVSFGLANPPVSVDRRKVGF